MKNNQTHCHITDTKLNPFNYNKNQSFFIIITKYTQIIKKLNDIKSLIPDKNSLKILSDKIKNIKDSIKELEQDKNILMERKFAEHLNNFEELNKSDSIYGINIQSILNENENKRITLKIIYDEYWKKFHKRISSMTISRVLRYHLKYHYRRTNVKNPKIKEIQSKIMSLIFLNIIIRALQLDLNIIYLDEVGFSLENSNYFTWKKEGDIIVGGAKNYTKSRVNALIAINEEKILLSKITTDNINSKTFKKFLKEIINDNGKFNSENSLIVMDNASYHISKSIQKFIEKQNVKIVTNVPYLSYFNSIELLFRAIKNITYKENFENIKTLKNRIEEIINNDKNKITIKKNYIETLEKYQKHLNDNLSKGDIENEIKNFLNKKRKRKSNDKNVK